MIMLDSTILIDFLRGVPAAVNKISKNDTRKMFTSDISLFELATGLCYSGVSPLKTEDILTKDLARFQVLPLTTKAAIQAGSIQGQLLHKGSRIGQSDALIAGIAKANNISTILTRNKKHFENIPGIKVVTY
jgi:predicted nucleic acid-binding protein